MKTCTDCGVEKDETQFRKKHNFCKACYQARYNTPERQHAARVKHYYGITADQYAQMLAEQDNRCAICCQEQSGKRLAVDHDHATGQVRGLLCSNCNRALGLFGDSSVHLLSAYHYLQKLNDSYTSNPEGSKSLGEIS
jgi:hypothetical protein